MNAESYTLNQVRSLDDPLLKMIVADRAACLEDV
jgi:hypothetical protein